MADADLYVAPLREFVVERFLEGNGDGLDADTPLLELGILDSFSIVEIVSFAEQRFGIGIPESELKPTSFGSISALAGLLDRLASDGS